jgi:TolB protein
MTQVQKSFFPDIKNIGDQAISGKIAYDSEKQSYELTCAGTAVQSNNDECFYTARIVSGDFILTSKVAFGTQTGNAHQKIGLMIRQSMESNSKFAGIILHTNGLLSLQYRQKQGANTEEVKFSESGAQYLQIEKKGSKILARIAQTKKALTVAKEIELTFQEPLFVGLMVASDDAAQMVSGLFANVRFDVPAADGVDGYEFPSASRLEILDTETGLRQVIYATQEHIEAPNWSRDGKFLIYNSGGKLYKFDLNKGTPEVIETGIAIHNNNDHGISFDGKTLAVSNHTQVNGSNASIIYTLPVKGGKAFRVTEKGPSYWHGWSPDGKLLVYCAGI